MKVELSTQHEREVWVNRMFTPSPQYNQTVPGFKQIQNIFWWLDKFGTWTLIKDVGLDLSFAELYQSARGEWRHVGDAHRRLGMAWAAWAIGIAEMDISLSDSPDIHGEWILPHGTVNVVGDIGRCTFSAWLDGCHSLENPGDIWISVLDRDTQIVVEMNGYMTKAMNALMAQRLKLSPPTATE